MPVTSPQTVSSTAIPTQMPTSQADVDAAELERLLARYIGPMARIILARALKSGATGAELVQSLAGSIDDETDRDAFVAAARRLPARGGR